VTDESGAARDSNCLECDAVFWTDGSDVVKNHVIHLLCQAAQEEGDNVWKLLA
jgi:hypothetical protein